ncbi:hypothetical protein ACWCQQ_32035 [Streptomyces sp. NPDC002143]
MSSVFVAVRGAFTLTEVAKETGLNRKTVRKYLSGQAPAAPLIDAMLKAEILIKGGGARAHGE